MVAKLREEDVKNEIFQYCGDTLVSAFDGTKKKIEIKCSHCNKNYTCTFHSFRQGRRCSCQLVIVRNKNPNLVRRRITYEIFEELLKEENYKMKTRKEELGDNFNYRTNVVTICPNDHEYSTYYDNYKNRRRRCPECKYEKIANDFKLLMIDAKELAKKAGLILLSDDYKNMKSEIKVKCINKGHVTITTLDSLKFKDTTCKECHQSKGEVLVNEVLTSFKNEKKFYDFISEFRMFNCRNIRPLPFDFAIFLKEENITNKNPDGLIEYDGLGTHFEPTMIDLCNDKNYLEKNKERDMIKTKFCYDNTIPLLRIDYKNFNNIEKLVIEFLELIKNNKKEKSLIFLSDCEMYPEFKQFTQ